ncbi:MAG: hypothetical protein QME52_12540 [Bacteroidota bacterium]|nr:hypothetical protein [Bacteroidota bacterium]
MLEILDGIIATGAVVLALSLIVQAIQQIMKQFFNLKSSYMERELVMMFLPDAVIKDFVKQWAGIAERLTPDWKIFKSIGGKERQIVDELKVKLRSIGYKDLEVLEKITVEQMQNIIGNLTMFSEMDEKSDNSLKKALSNVKTWFEITKQAFQEHYERKMKVWALGISTVVVLSLNANLFEIYSDFSQNKILRDAAVAWIEKVTSQHRDSIITYRMEDKPDSIVIKQKSDTALAADIRKNISEIQAMVNTNSFQIMRWNKFEGCRSCDLTCFGYLLKIFLGLLAMILLVSLGAPFWYDLLKTIMNLKNKLKEDSYKS